MTRVLGTSSARISNGQETFVSSLGNLKRTFVSESEFTSRGDFPYYFDKLIH